MARSGWKPIAQRYPASPESDNSARRFSFQTVAVLAGGSHGQYKSAISVSIGALGISLRPIFVFRPFHAELRVPWTEIAEVEKTSMAGPEGVLVRTRDNMGVFLTGEASEYALREWGQRRTWASSSGPVDPSPIRVRTAPSGADRNQLVQEIGKLILQDSAYSTGDWRALALVFTMETGVSSISGFKYSDGGPPSAELPDEAEQIQSVAEALRTVMSAETGTEWRQMLYQVWFPGPDFRADFSYEGSDRWALRETAGLRPEAP